jgi:predicted amidohydrolase YtcJ
MRTIIKNAKIYIHKDYFVEALSIENGIIKQIGKLDELEKSNSDEVIDLKGKTILPGLNDSHLHLASVGEFIRSCDLTSAASIEDVIKIGKAFILEHAPHILVGRGWNQDFFSPNDNRMIDKNDLDRISMEIPIIFSRVCGHVSVGNSKALEIIGLADAHLVDGGEILIGNDGKPNGIFTENAVYTLYSIIPEKSSEELESDLEKGMNYAISVGITSVQSCDIMGSNSRMVFNTIDRMYREGKLKLRYGHQFNYQNINDFKNYLMTEHLTGIYDERFLSKGALKLFKDGSLGARTALMTRPYADDPSTSGVAALSDQQLFELCDLAAANGIQVITHAIGDAAIESVINAYENTFSGETNPLRHGIVHCQITTAKQIERISKSRIPVMAQPIFIDYDMNIVESRVGFDLASTSYAFKTLLDSGAPLNLGTDAPVENCNPFPNIYSAVTRKPIKNPTNKCFLEKEKLTVEEAIDAYTIGSAYNEFKENFKGRLLPGYVADLIVLDRDIFLIDSMEIKDIKVDMTMIDGKIVYTCK